MLAHDDDHRSLEARGDTRDNGRDGHDDITLHRRCRDAGDPDLHAERDHDEHSDDQSQHVCSNCRSDIATCDARAILSDLSVGVEDCAGGPAAHEDAANGVAEQAKSVDDEDVGSTLLGACEEEEHNEKSDCCTALGPVDDGQAGSVGAIHVEELHGDRDVTAICMVDDDWLLPWIEFLLTCTWVHLASGISRTWCW